MRNLSVCIGTTHHIQWLVNVSPVNAISLQANVHPRSHAILLLGKGRDNISHSFIPSALVCHFLWLFRKFAITNRTDNQSLSVGVAAIVSSVIDISIPSVAVGIQSIGNSLHRIRILIPLNILNGHHLWLHSIDKLGSTSSSLLVKFHLSMINLCLRVVLAYRRSMEVLHLTIYLINQLLRVNITNISSNNMLPEVVAIYTAYLLVILHCQHWVDDALQALFNKTATTKVGSSLNESAIKVLQRKLRVTLYSFCNMYSLLVGLFPSLRFRHHRFQREFDIVATIDSFIEGTTAVTFLIRVVVIHW